jgi:hypothetical protein
MEEMSQWENLIAEKKQETIEEYQKSQNIRIIDVTFIAPVCVYAGLKATQLPNWIRISLVGIGLATFYYNGKNYLINKQNERK